MAETNDAIVIDATSEVQVYTDATNDHRNLSNRDAANQHPISSITNLQSSLDAKQANLIAGDAITIESNRISAIPFPVGAIYMSVVDTDPSLLFGGTWAKIQGKFLIGECANTYAFLCAENDSFTLTQSANIRFGKGDAWATTTLAAGTYTASATGLGVTDPCSGVTKVVEIELAAGATGGELSHTLNTTEMPSHNHTYSHVNRTSFEESGSGTSHYQVTSYSTYGTGSTGGGKEHNNMPPFLVVYMWQRTA